ncbi:monocarboxylate transporter 14-like [Euwallacea similis]|uniref:monocarboxylate transporter 14-like n=1 Tax=Euwallacea similis TaxID=1736056 RepID=UPI003450836C
MSSNIDAAPLARMSRIAPSLDSLVTKPIKSNVIIPLETIKKPVEAKPSTSTDNDYDENPNIPDGGWGWVVVAATFFLCMIADGVAFSFGMLYDAFLLEFEASNSATSWIGSLFMAVPLLTGPVMSALVDKFGCRSMTIVGAVISASGFILSSKCYSIKLMYLTFGIIAGLGMGLIYVTLVVSVAFWFDKKRTLAVGISSAGIGIGTFAFSPFTTYLIMEFGWRGTTLILGGFFLNMCVCGALMRDPDWIAEQEKQNSKSKLNKSEKSSNASLENPINVDELRALLTSDQDVKVLLKDLETNLGDDEDTKKLTNYFQSSLNLPTFVRQHEKVPVEVLELLTHNKNVSNVILAHYPSLVLSNTKSSANIANGKELLRSPSVHQDSWPKGHEATVHEPLLHRKNSIHEKYFKNLKMDKHSLVLRGVTFNTNKYRFKASSCPNIYRVSMVEIPEDHEEKWYSGIMDLLKDMFDYSLFTELHFVLLSLSTIIFFTWFIVPYFYLNVLMKKNAYNPEESSFTISNIGISNTIGMAILGWAGDRPWMNITKAYAGFLIICGLSIAGQIYFIKNMVMLQICSSLFGLGMSSHFAFTPGIVMELVPIDRFTIAYGLQLLCQGIGTLVGPPYAGLLFDITKTWEQTFYQASIWIILSGIFIWFIPYVKNRKLIGKGDVEKKLEGDRDKTVPLTVLLLILILCFILICYLTAKAVHTYYDLKAEEES